MCHQLALKVPPQSTGQMLREMVRELTCSGLAVHVDGTPEGFAIYGAQAREARELRDELAEIVSSGKDHFADVRTRIKHELTMFLNNFSGLAVSCPDCRARAERINDVAAAFLARQ